MSPMNSPPRTTAKDSAHCFFPRCASHTLWCRYSVATLRCSFLLCTWWTPVSAVLALTPSFLNVLTSVHSKSPNSYTETGSRINRWIRCCASGSRYRGNPRTSSVKTLFFPISRGTSNVPYNIEITTYCSSSSLILLFCSLCAFSSSWKRFSARFFFASVSCNTLQNFISSSYI